MSIVWVASYILLWALVVGMGLLGLGLLQQVGLLQQRLDQELSGRHPEQAPAHPAIDEDGPPIGAAIPMLEADSANGFGVVHLPLAGDNRRNTLLILLSAMCETCQQLVEPLNALVAEQGIHRRDLRIAAILRADPHGARAFMTVFPLKLPIILDHDHQLTKGLGVHRTPFGLLYDEHGTLVRKGVLLGADEVLALLGDPSAPAEAKLQVYPAPAEQDVALNVRSDFNLRSDF